MGVAGEEPAAQAKLGRSEAERLLGDRFGGATNFEKNESGTDHGDPEFGSALAFAHPGFGWALGDWFVGENADPDLALPFEGAVDGDAASLDLLAGNPGAAERLQAELTEVDLGATGSVARAASAVGLAKLGSAGNQCHMPERDAGERGWS